MTALTAPAIGRIGFRIVQAGSREIIRAALSRTKLWLLARFLPLMILAFGGIHPAHADGTIANGQTVTGTVTGAGVDSYTFSVPTGGGSFIASVSETGTHDANFMPRIDIVPPGGATGAWSAHAYYATIEQDNVAEGTWTIKVSRADQLSTGGSYALTLVQVPGALSGGITATAMSAGSSYSGTNTRGNLQVFTFTGVAGQPVTLTLTATGGEGFDPKVSVYAPAGEFAAGFNCVDSCGQDVPIATGGLYTVVVTKSDDNDVTGTYTLSVNNKN
jgi:hypothetical protein